MKSLIFVTAYCPDLKRKEQLSNCINSLQSFRDKYDIAIVSHTPIPLEITEKVNYTIYDKENPILTDLDYLSSSWGIPFEDCTIYSTFVGKGTYVLAIFRLMSLGYGLAKTMGYKKIHHIDYDNVINDISCIDDNDNLLDENEYVFYTHSGESSDFLLGFSLSYTTDGTIDINKEFNEDLCLDLLTQRLAPEILVRNQILSKKFICKKLTELSSFPNQIGLSGKTYTPNWCIPFYDSEDHKFKFIAWNNYFDNGRECSIIINKEQYINFGVLPKHYWRLIDIADYENLNYLQIILDNTLEYDIEFTPEYKKKFIKSNFSIKKTLPGYG